MGRISAFILFGALGALSACKSASSQSGGGGDGNLTPTEKTSAMLLQEIKSNIQAACTTSSDCMIVALGDRPCGGAESYSAVSKWDGMNALSGLVYSYYLARRKDNEGKTGTCEALMPPKVTCSSNKCKKQSSAAAGGSALIHYTGSLSLSPKNLADAPAQTFKITNGATNYYVSLAHLDLNAKAQIEAKRQNNKTVKLSVRIFARQISASACDFTFADCSTKVTALDVRAIVIK